MPTININVKHNGLYRCLGVLSIQQPRVIGTSISRGKVANRCYSRVRNTYPVQSVTERIKLRVSRDDRVILSSPGQFLFAHTSRLVASQDVYR